MNRYTSLGEVMRHRKGSITINEATTYKLCRVQVHRRGVVLRQELAGAAISTKKQQVCKAGDFLVAEMDAKVGGYGFVPPELDGAIVSSHYYLFEVDKKKLHPPYLEVVSQAEILQQQIVAKGSTNYSSIRPGSVLDWQIPLPEDIEVQKRIARNFQAIQTKLTAVSEEITHQETLLAKLQQAILQEAIQGKLTADWRAAHPQAEPASQLLRRIAEHRITQFESALAKASELGQRKPKKLRGLMPPIAYELPEWPELPPSWVVTVIDKIGTVCVGSTPDRHRKEYWGGSIPWVSSGEVANCFIHDTEEKISDEGFKQASVTLHPPGTVLIAMIGQGKTRGQSAILKIAACTNQNSASVVIYHGLIVPEFLWMVFLARYNESRGAATGGNQPALNGEKIGRIPLRLPPLAEQAAIVARVETLLGSSRLLAAEIAHTRTHAAHLLQAVLKEAFTPAT